MRKEVLLLLTSLLFVSVFAFLIDLHSQGNSTLQESAIVRMITKEGLVLEIPHDSINVLVALAYWPTLTRDEQIYFKRYSENTTIHVEFITFEKAKIDGFPLLVSHIKTVEQHQ